jgi:hypothetical protein
MWIGRICVKINRICVKVCVCVNIHGVCVENMWNLRYVCGICVWIYRFFFKNYVGVWEICVEICDICVRFGAKCVWIL